MCTKFRCVLCHVELCIAGKSTYSNLMNRVKYNVKVQFFTIGCYPPLPHYTTKKYLFLIVWSHKYKNVYTLFEDFPNLGLFCNKLLQSGFYSINCLFYNFTKVLILFLLWLDFKRKTKLIFNICFLKRLYRLTWQSFNALCDVFNVTIYISVLASTFFALIKFLFILI